MAKANNAKATVTALGNGAHAIALTPNNGGPGAVVLTTAIATGMGPSALLAATAKRYGANAGMLSPAFANRTFTLSTLGATVAASGGLSGAGRPTTMGLTAVALMVASNGTGSATGAAIVAAMLSPALAARIAATKANGYHTNGANPMPAKVAQGYVNGLCRPAHGLAA